MKRFLAFMFAAGCLQAAAQGNIDLTLKTITNDGKPLGNLQVTATETTTQKQVKGKTDAQGKVRLMLSDGKVWSFDIGELRQCFRMPSIARSSVVGNKDYIYDPADFRRKKLQRRNRSTEKYKIIDQNNTEATTYDNTQCKLALKVQQMDGTLLKGLPVFVVNSRDSIAYRSRTDDQGRVYFILPNKTNYDIDVADVPNFAYADFANERVRTSLVLVFEPTVVKEKTVRDTTYQEVAEQARPSSARTLLRIDIKDAQGKGPNENVFLRELNSGKTFVSRANATGSAVFLVPTGSVFLVDLESEKNVDAVDLRYTEELTSISTSVRYTPVPMNHPVSAIPVLGPNLSFKDRAFLLPIIAQAVSHPLVKGLNTFLQKQYPKPKDKPFHFGLRSIRKLNKNSREALFLITLAGSDIPRPVPMNACLTIDKSGSMYSEGRAEALKTALLAIAPTLGQKDNLSVVVFDDFPALVQAPGTHVERLKSLSENYEPGGGTNILGGLQMASDILKKTFDPARANKVLLLTDGYGDNPPKSITDFVEAKAREGIEFSTIGLGSSFNQPMLELIAEKSNGTFSFVDSSAALQQAFVSAIYASNSYSVTDLRIEIYHHEQLLFSSLDGFPIREKTKESISFNIKRVPYRENKIAFLKFKLNNPSPALETIPLRIKMKYFDLAKNDTVRSEQEVKLEWTEETNTELELDQDEKTMFAISILSQSIKLMGEAYTRKDTDAARQALTDGKQQIREIFPNARPKEVRKLLESVDRYLQLLNDLENGNKAQQKRN